MSPEHHIPPPIAGTTWRTSSYSGGQGNCVEIADSLPTIPVRDSKRPAGPVLNFNRAAWQAFVTHLG